MKDLEHYLDILVERKGSDLFFSAGAPVHIKIEGIMEPLEPEPLTPEDVKELAYALMSETQAAAFAERPEMNLARGRAGAGRFRINIYRQRGAVAMVIRFLTEDIPELDSLGLPPILQDLVMERRGIIFLVGATGSGKSTTLAAMVDHFNRNRVGHVLAVEDPIEYIHQYKQSIVDQREVGFDTHGYADALKNAMREAPDVVLIGEIRDRETMEHAFQYSETGHLCLTTLHGNNTYQALERVVTFFPPDAREQLFMALSLNLRAILSQRLVIGLNGKRLPATELLLPTPLVRDLILKGRIDAIRDAIARNTEEGSHTFDQSLYRLHREGKISQHEALAHAESPSNLSVMIRTHGGARSII
jgi:twitching motility protein PilU